MSTQELLTQGYVRLGCTKGNCASLVLTEKGLAAISPAGPPAGTKRALGSTSPQAGWFGAWDLMGAYARVGIQGSGIGRTVAVVNQGSWAHMATDLAVYRQYYQLPPCGEGSSSATSQPCLTEVNSSGGADLPPDDGNGTELMLDLDMVSANCPYCHILVVDMDGSKLDQFKEMAKAVSTAVALGANAVSTSLSLPESVGAPDESSLESSFEPKNVPVVAAAGDDGYNQSMHNGKLVQGAVLPAAYPYVVAVGGTRLTRSSSNSRGFVETAWANGGSGCSANTNEGNYDNMLGLSYCGGHRAYADISYVADPATPVAEFDTMPSDPGWKAIGGTSIGAPAIAAIAATAQAWSGLYGNANIYAALFHDGEPAGFDPDSGSNCGNQNLGPGNVKEILCKAIPGWDGPTGVGTPSTSTFSY